MLLPGGADAVLWAVTNEPEVAFQRLEPPTAGVAAVHYPAAEIRRQLEALRATPDKEDASGKVVVVAAGGSTRC